MPSRVTIEKLYQGEYWTNVYWFSGAISAVQGASIADLIAIERSVHLSPVLITKVRIDDAVPLTDQFVTETINLFGLRTIGSEHMLPLFNVVRVDLTAGLGRPSRKYYRGALHEGDVNFNTIAPATVSFYNTDVAAALASLSGFVDVDGTDITAGTTHPFVGMRQLRRGSKKKTTP